MNYDSRKKYSIMHEAITMLGEYNKPFAKELRFLQEIIKHSRWDYDPWREIINRAQSDYDLREG